MALHIFPQHANPRRPELRLHTVHGKRPEQSQTPCSLMEATSCGLTGVSFEVHDDPEISPIVITNSANHVKYSIPPAASPRSMPATVSPRNIRTGSSRELLSPVADNSPMTPASPENLPQEPVSPHFSTPNRRVDTPQQAIPMRSIFPQLQPGIPLAQQEYRPVVAPASGLPRQLISKGTEMNTSQALPQPHPPHSHRPFATSVPERQTQPALTPISSRAESLEVWDLANGDRNSSAMTIVHYDLKRRTIQDGQRGITRPGIELHVVDAAGTKLYTTKLSPSTAMQGSIESCRGDLNVQRRHPEGEETFPVAQMDLKLPISGFAPSAEHNEGVSSVTSIFPQAAALSAIRSVADSLQARSIARFDRDATSPQAAQLAFDAVQCVKEAEEANLVFRTSPQPSSSSAGAYELQHPVLGPLGISVQGHINLFEINRTGLGRREPTRRGGGGGGGRGSITMRGPSLRPGCTVDLASLNLEKEKLTLHIEALGALESQFMLDTAVCALVAVAVAESFRPQNGGSYHHACHFAAPPIAVPRAPGVVQARRGPAVDSDRRSPRRWHLFRISSKGDVTPSYSASSSSSPAATGARAADADGPVEKLPPALRAVLKLLAFSFQAAVWVLGSGVKVLVKLVSCVAGWRSQEVK